MKNILVPTDFSENSWNAIQYASAFFEKVRCNIYLLHVVDILLNSMTDAALGTPLEVIDKAVEIESEKKLSELLDKIYASGLNPHHNYTTLSEYDLLVDGVRKATKKYEIDLIVMGTKGATGLKEKILGTHTGDVLVRVKCPLLTVPEKATFHTPKEIVFPTDFRMPYSTKIVKVLKDMAVIHNSAIRFLYIAKDATDELDQDQQYNKNTFFEYFEKYEHSFHKLTNQKLEAAIECFIESRDIAMIAMVAKNLNFLQQILFKPTVAEIGYHTKIPFLVLHE